MWSSLDLVPEYEKKKVYFCCRDTIEHQRLTYNLKSYDMPRFLTLLLVISPQTRSCTDKHGWRLSSGFLRWCSSYCLNRTHYVTYPLITLKLGWCEIVYLWFVSYLSVLYWWFDEWWCGSSLCSWDKTRLKKKTSTPHTYTLVLVFHSKHTATQKLGLTIHDIGHASILNTRKHIHILLKQIYTLMWCLIIRIFVSVCCVVYFQQDRTDTEKKKKETYVSNTALLQRTKNCFDHDGV